jgi:hypothetical protein
VHAKFEEAVAMIIKKIVSPDELTANCAGARARTASNWKRKQYGFHLSFADWEAQTREVELIFAYDEFLNTFVLVKIGYRLI